MKRPRARTVAKWLLVNLLVLIGADYAFYLRYRRRLQDRAHPNMATLSRQSGLPLDVLHAVGSFRYDEPERRDLRRLPLRHPGRARIVALGDSFTYGDEVAPALAFPRQLERRLRAAGLDAEVINFGSSWYGFGQAAALYERLARSYQPDFVVIGPECLYPDRDETFNHTDDVFSSYIHGRWVLDGKSVRFVEPPGEPSFEDRLAAYYAFLPRWRVLRYDRRAPPFLRALVPAGKRLANPFYYSKLTLDEEAAQLYPRLLARIAASGAQVILLHQRLDVAELARGLPLIWGAIAYPKVFPYLRSGLHLSAMGNDFVAQGFAAALTGGSAMLDAIAIQPGEGGPPGEPLDGVDRIEVRLADRRAATLIEAQPPSTLEGDTPVAPVARKIAALLGLAERGDTMFDGLFVPLDRALRADSQLAVEVSSPTGTTRLAVEAPRFVAGTQVAWVQFGPVRSNGGTLWFDVTRRGLTDATSARLLVDGRAVLELKGHAQRLQAVGALAMFRPGREDALIAGDLPPRGDVALVLLPGERKFKVGEFVHRAKELKYEVGGKRRLLE